MPAAWGRRSRRAIALAITFVLSMLLAAAPAAAADTALPGAAAAADTAPPDAAAAAPSSVQNFTYESFEADYYLVRGA
ncbi:MAG TPA: hypothetical protein VEX42_11065, partial [Microbacterium sp.]|nr:hypothetical protein [Microbacterium sp.]